LIDAGQRGRTGISSLKKLKDFKAWAKASPEHRPFVWFTVEESKQKFKEKSSQIKNNAN
jgi:hypothetical protein